MRTKLFVLLIAAIFASKEYENDTNAGEIIEDKNTDNLIVVKIEEDEYVKDKFSSDYFGVTYIKKDLLWRAYRWSKNEKKAVYNGCYDNEETAAHASDTLARKLMKKGQQGHKLNFPDDDTEVYSKRIKATSDYFGVTYQKSKWLAQRRGKNEKKMVYNGYYDNEETAAHASDTLARKLMDKGEQGHKLNFPDNDTEVHKNKFTSDYIGVGYNKGTLLWRAYRWRKNENKVVYNGSYDNEETAAHASDTLARQLMQNGEQNLNLNFPDDNTEVHPEEKKYTSKYFGVSYNGSKWRAERRSKKEKKKVFCGSFENEKEAAYASDTLAKKLIENGEQGHKLNFPDEDTEMHPELSYQKKKRKRQENFQDK